MDVPSYSTCAVMFFSIGSATTEFYTLSLHDALPISLEISTQSAEPTLANLTVTDNITGIRLEKHTNAIQTVHDIVFARNTDGAHVLSGASTTVSGATFTDNTNRVLGQGASAATVMGG